MTTLRLIALLTVTTLTAHAAPQEVYEVVLKDVAGARSGTERILELAFYSKLPPTQNRRQDAARLTGGSCFY